MGLRIYINPFPDNHFRFFQAQEIPDNNFEFDENGPKFSKRVENTGVGGKDKLLVTSNSPFPHSVFTRRDK